MSQQFNWVDVTEDDEKERYRKPDLQNDWRYYAWAGGNQLLAKRRGLAFEPTYITSEYAQGLSGLGTQAPEPVAISEPGVRRLSTTQEQSATPGEIFSKAVGAAFQLLSPTLANAPKNMSYLGTNASDFMRGAVYGSPQTVADVGGSVLDIISGNTGRNQSYTLAGNRPQDYNDISSVAATVGQFAPDIAMAVGTFGGAAPLMAAAAARKGAIGALGRAAMGSADAAPKAITAFGRAISPAATRATRVAATLAGAVPTATNVLPEVTAGRMSAVEGGLMTAIGGLGGTFAAGQWGGSRLANVLSDMGVNIAAQGASEAVTLLPGGAQFDAAQAWKNMLYGAGLGAAFGVMNARPIEGPGQRAVLGQPVREAPTMPPPSLEVAAARSMGGADKMVEMVRNSEAILYGEPRLAFDATQEQAGQAVMAMRQANPAEFATLALDETGAVRSVSDAHLRGEAAMAFPGMPKSSIAEAAEIERTAYANSLAAEYAQNPETLIKVLDLETVPGEITPENAQQMLAMKIKNEWLVQAANGKGISAVEQRLQQAGLRQPPQAQSPGPGVAAPESAVIPEGGGPMQAPESAIFGRTPMLPEAATPAVNAGVGPSVVTPALAATGGVVPRTAETAAALERLRQGEGTIQLPESTLPVDGAIAGEPIPAEVAVPRAVGPVEQIEMDFGPEVVDALAQARMTSDLTGLPIEEIVPEGSRILEANRALERAVAAEQPTPVEAVAAEAPTPTTEKAKRKRIARVSAKNETEAEIRDAIASATETKTYSTETAVASADPRDAAANVVGQKIASLVDNLHLLKTEARQQGRTAVEQLQNLAQILRGDGAEVTIRQPKAGGRANSIEQMLADLSSMQLREFRQAVADGQADFAGGAVRIEPVLPTEGATPTGRYTVAFPEKNILNLVEDAFLAARNGATPEVKDNVAARREAKVKADRLYGSSEEINEIFAEQTSLGGLYKEVPEGLTFEAREAFTRSEDGDIIDGPEYVDERTDMDVVKSEWRMRFTTTMRGATDEVVQTIKRAKQWDNSGLTPVDVKNQLLSIMAPGRWQEMGTKYLDRTVTNPEKRAKLTELVNMAITKIYNQGAGKVTVIDRLMDSARDVPDTYFDKMYDRYTPKFEEANEYADRIATKLGLEDAREIWRYIEWQKAGKRPTAKRKLLDEWQEKTMESVEFDDARATAIAERLDPLMREDADVNYSFEKLSGYINDRKGAEAFQNILDYNLSGGRKKPELTLRDLPTIRMGGGLAVLYGLDDYVEDVKDDETYFGIPGSTLRTFLGDGNTMSYAMAGVFGVGLKSNMKHGQRNGFRARTGNTLRKAATSISRIGGQHRAVSRMPIEQQNVLADNFMVKNHPSIKPGTPDYENIKAEYLRNQKYADLSGGKITDIVNAMTGNTGAGTVGLMAKVFSDIKNLGMRSQFMQDYVVDPYVRLQSQIRRVSKTVEDPINAVLPGLVARRGKSGKFWDAIWNTDYRMSQVQQAENFELSPEALREARTEVLDEIKRDYFTTNEIVDSAGWEDFMAFQKAVDTLRGEDLRGLVARSLGINSWEIDSHYGELKLSRDATQEAFGAAREARDTFGEQLDALVGQFETIKNGQGLETAMQMMPGFKEARQQIKRSKAEAQANVNRLGKELRRIETRMERIETLDSMIEKSMANMYMYRHRDSKAPFVGRLYFDESTGLPSVRREYYSIEDAELGETEYLRLAALKKMNDMPEYMKYVEKRKELQDELARLNDTDVPSDAIDQRIVEINKELDQLDGYKPLSEMTDAEVMRFAQTYEMLGPGKTIRDMRSRVAARLGTKRANLIIDQIIAAADPVKAQILSRTVDSGSITPRYVKGKGNASLVDTDSPDVVMYSGKDAPSVDDLVDAIVEQVDTPIDTMQLRDLLERNYTYRDTAVAPNGKTSETIWVDMTAIRNAVEAYMDPYVPNLTRRNNWVGYYNPDGNWTPKEKMAYTVQSLESMIGRIKNYNQHTALRRTVADAMDWLNKWDINNGLREYIAGMAHFNEPMFNEGTLATLDQATATFSRYVSQGTLFLNMSSALGNRIQGATIAGAHGWQNLATRHGVRKTNADGTPSAVQWMPSEAAADAFIKAQHEKGDGSYRRVEGFRWQGLADPRNYGIGVAAMVAPEATLRLLAHKDGWGVNPPSQQGYWALVYEAQRKANLKQGGIVGSYAVKEGVETGTWSQTLSKIASKLTDTVERMNNTTSILMAAADGQSKFGMTDADWRTLNLGQRTDAIDQIMQIHNERFSQSASARAVIQDEIERLRQAKAVATPVEAEGFQKQIDIKLERLAKTQDEKSILFDALTDYLVYNRGYDQGNWDMMSKAKFERFILSAPGGRLAMTMTAPILRAMNSWQGLARRAGATEGGTMAKLGRSAAPLMGASILTVLLGGAASTAVGLGGVFVSDMAHLGEYLYHYFTEEDGDKLDKIAPRQVWERLAEDMAPKYGINPKDAREFVRKFWSEGMIRYYGDVNISAGAGIFDITAGGTPAQVVPANAKAAWDAIVGVVGAFKESTTPYDFVWGISNALPTSGKRLLQTGLVTMTPAALGGQGAVKVDKNGNPVIDAFTGQPQALSGWDLTKQTLFGKPWKDTRTMLVSREGGTPLYTPNDRAAWANHLARGTKYLNFDKEGGRVEAVNAAHFERDAEDLQRLITAKYRGYRDILENGKNYVLEMYRNNEGIDIGNGTVVSFRQILAETATSGIIPETELKGRNAQSMRDKLIKDMEDWARARAARDAISTYYGGETGATLSDAVENQNAPENFALIRLGEAYRKAYRQGLIRRGARARMQ